MFPKQFAYTIAHKEVIMGNYDHPVTETVKSLFKEETKKIRVMLEIRENEQIVLTMDLECLKNDIQALSQLILSKLK